VIVLVPSRFFPRVPEGRLGRGIAENSRRIGVVRDGVVRAVDLRVAAVDRAAVTRANFLRSLAPLSDRRGRSG